MSQKKGGSLGGLGGTARGRTGPPSFSSQPRSLAGTNHHLLSFDGRPAHQGSLCWTASGLLVDKIRPKPRWSGSLLAVCPVSCWSGVKTDRWVERGKKRLRTQNGAWGSMGRRTGSSENGPASASGSVGSGEPEERGKEIADGRQMALLPLPNVHFLEVNKPVKPSTKFDWSRSDSSSRSSVCGPRQVGQAKDCPHAAP